MKDYCRVEEKALSMNGDSYPVLVRNKLIEVFIPYLNSRFRPLETDFRQQTHPLWSHLRWFAIIE